MARIDVTEARKRRDDTRRFAEVAEEKRPGAYEGQRAARGAMTAAQRRLIRTWRTDLGRAIWNTNESDLMHELRLKREVGKPWTEAEIAEALYRVDYVFVTAAGIANQLKQFLKRATGERGLRRKLSPQYKKRLEGALNGLIAAAIYLRHLSPEYLEKYDLMREASLKDLRRASRRESDDVEMTTAERVEFIMFEGCPLTTSQVRTLNSLGSRGMAVTGGCYTNGIKALRGAVMQLYYSLQASDVRRIRLADEDSEMWHQHLKEYGTRPPGLVEQFEVIADEEQRSIHVVDAEGEVVDIIVPLSLTAGSLRERTALRKSKRARMQWEFDYRQRTPQDVAEFRKSLTPAQQKRVTEFLERNRRATSGRKRAGFTLEEIAALADVPFRSTEEAQFQRKAAAQFKRNPSGDTEEIAEELEWTTNVAHDAGLISALWKMDV